MNAGRQPAVSHALAPGREARTILVVEDNELVRETIARGLEDAGYTVVEAATAEDGLDALEGREINVLFTDIRLPGPMDGWRLAEKARALKPDLPVIYATGFSAEAPRLVPDGVLLKKPYTPSTVIDTIERLAAAR